MTKLQRLLEDARAAGYEVTRDGDEWHVLKVVTVNQHRKERVGLVILASGWAVDVSIDSCAEKCIRSTDTMRKILGIKGGGE